MSRSLSHAISETTRTLERAGISGSARDARALVAAAAQIARDRLTLRLDGEMTDAASERLARFVGMRLQRRPVSHIVGARMFWGREFRVSGDVLDPRPETEALIAAALDGPRFETVLDMGTGSGILAITLAAERGHATAIATDISDPALAVAQGNADQHGVASRISFRRANWWDGIVGTFDLIVSNPPYIPEADIETLADEVRLWEPREALTPGGDGLDSYRRIAGGLDRHLEAGGRGLFEFGAGQEDAVREIFERTDKFRISTIDDMDARPRVAEVARKA